VIIQILLLDIVFSLDSVITAVGMANNLWVMIAAVVIALGVMLVFAGAIGDFVNRHPTLKMLALSFLILIGVTLVAEALGQHIPKGYIYFSMAFAFAVEMLNLRLRAKQQQHVHRGHVNALVEQVHREHDVHPSLREVPECLAPLLLRGVGPDGDGSEAARVEHLRHEPRVLDAHAEAERSKLGQLLRAVPHLLQHPPCPVIVRGEQVAERVDVVAPAASPGDVPQVEPI
jgi:hypothetical protein